LSFYDLNGFNDFNGLNEFAEGERLNPPASPERLAMAGRRFEWLPMLGGIRHEKGQE